PSSRETVAAGASVAATRTTTSAWSAATSTRPTAAGDSSCCAPSWWRSSRKKVKTMGRKAATKTTSEKDLQDRAMLVFLSAMSDGATIGEAAHEAGVDRTTVYRWKEADPEFAAAWDDSLEEGTERLEREAMRRAVVGVEEPVI